ncbi:uncharacterized protein [Clytia hemisphaerica]
MDFSGSIHEHTSYVIDEEIMEFLGETNNEDDSHENNEHDDDDVNDDVKSDDIMDGMENHQVREYEKESSPEEPQEWMAKENTRQKSLHKIILEQDDGNMLNDIKQELIDENELFDLCQQHYELSDQYFTDIVDSDNALYMKTELLEELKETIEQIIDISSNLSTADVISSCVLVNPPQQAMNQSITMRGVRIEDPEFLMLYVNWTLHGDQVMDAKDFHRMLDEKEEDIKTSARHLKEHYVIRWNYLVSLMKEQYAHLRENHWLQMKLFDNFLVSTFETMKTRYFRSKLQITTNMAKTHVQSIENGDYVGAFERQESIVTAIDIISNTPVNDRYLKYKMMNQIKESYFFSGDHRGNCFQYCDEWNRHLELVIEDSPTSNKHSVYTWLDWLHTLLTIQEYKIAFPETDEPNFPNFELQENSEPDCDKDKASNGEGCGKTGKNGESEEERMMRLFGFINDEKEDYPSPKGEYQLQSFDYNQILDDQLSPKNEYQLQFPEIDQDLDEGYGYHDPILKIVPKSDPTVNTEFIEILKSNGYDMDNFQEINSENLPQRPLQPHQKSLFTRCYIIICNAYNNLMQKLNDTFSLVMVYLAKIVVERPYILVNLCYILLFTYCFYRNDDNYVKKNYIRI